MWVNPKEETGELIVLFRTLKLKSSHPNVDIHFDILVFNELRRVV
jgi:hypothetical protein